MVGEEERARRFLVAHPASLPSSASGSNHEGEAAVIRRRQVYPDESGVVTREALLEAMIDAATFLDFAGGVLSS
jgi:hypothetical protein